MGELIKQLDIRGISWRSLLLTGALPALLLVMCVVGYTEGWAGYSNLITKLADFKDKWPSIVQVLAAFVLLAATFVTLRTLILDFYRGIPIPLLHGWLLQRHARRRKEVELAKERALWRISVARWHEQGFDRRVYMVDEVRTKVVLPPIAKIMEECDKRRAQIAEKGFFSPWRRFQLERSLGRLYVVASLREKVARRAAEVAERVPGQSDDANWTQAQRELGVDAPDDWIDEELLRWRTLCVGNERAKTRIAALHREELNDRYTRASRRADQFPSAEWTEASSLGNVLAALEGYSAKRYGIDTSLLWSRVEKVIPLVQRDEVYTAQIAVYSLLNTSVAMTAAGIYALYWSWTNFGEVRTTLALHSGLIALMFVLAWVFWRSAVYAGGQLRYQIEAMVDLYTPRLLASLGLVPKDLTERRNMIEALGRFVDGSKMDAFNYPLQPITDPVLAIDKSK
ncbi:MAG: hypothetical protein WDN23_14570 [Edaphobacter sp.]